MKTEFNRWNLPFEIKSWEYYMQIVLNFKQSIVNEILVDYMLVTIIRKPLAANDNYDDDNDDDDVSTVVYNCYECFTQRTVLKCSQIHYVLSIIGRHCRY